MCALLFKLNIRFLCLLLLQIMVIIVIFYVYSTSFIPVVCCCKAYMYLEALFFKDYILSFVFIPLIAHTHNSCMNTYPDARELSDKWSQNDNTLQWPFISWWHPYSMVSFSIGKCYQFKDELIHEMNIHQLISIWSEYLIVFNVKKTKLSMSCSHVI